ncbi:MAG: RidA family protein [Candidatus Dormibacterales bacterium]
MGLRRIRLEGPPGEPPKHYSDAVLAGGWLWVSGMMATGEDGMLVGGDDAGAQAEQVITNLEAALDAGGARLADVVKVTVYLTAMSDRPAVNAVRRRRFGEHRPASVLVQVAALAVPGARLEIDAVALLPGAGAPAVEAR